MEDNLFPFTLNCGWRFLNCDWKVFKSTNKANFLHFFEKKHLFQNSRFPFTTLFKHCKKHVRRGYPFAGPCMCTYKLTWTLAIKKQSFWLICIFSPFPFALNCGWMVFELKLDDALQKHKQSKPLTMIFQANCSFKKTFRQMQKTCPQRVPPCRPLHVQSWIDMNICNKKQPF